MTEWYTTLDKSDYRNIEKPTLCRISIGKYAVIIQCFVNGKWCGIHDNNIEKLLLEKCVLGIYN